VFPIATIYSHLFPHVEFPTTILSFVEPCGVQALKNQNPLKDVEAFVVLVVALLF